MKYLTHFFHSVLGLPLWVEDWRDEREAEGVREELERVAWKAEEDFGQAWKVRKCRQRNVNWNGAGTLHGFY